MHKFCIESGNIFCVFRNSTHPRVGYPNRSFVHQHENDEWHHRIRKATSFRFGPSKRKRPTGIFKNLHSGVHVQKPAFLVAKKGRLRVCGRLKSSFKEKKNSRIETDTCGRGLIQNTGKATADWLVNRSVGWVPDFKTVGPDSILCQSNTQGLKMTKGVLPSLCL